MRKLIVAGATALLLTGSSLAYAQQSTASTHDNWRPSAADWDALTERGLPP